LSYFLSRQGHRAETWHETAAEQYRSAAAFFLPKGPAFQSIPPRRRDGKEGHKLGNPLDMYFNQAYTIQIWSQPFKESQGKREKE